MCKNNPNGCSCHIKDVNVVKSYNVGVAGAKGDDGADGLTPYIGINGNWWIGLVDTGTSATGGGSSQSVKNGLSIDIPSGDFVLGGALDRDTTIDTDTYDLIIGGSNKGRIYLSNTATSFGSNVGGFDFVGLTTSITLGALIEDTVFGVGLGDAQDYSANKTAFSYITKQMLDNSINFTSSNGITKVGKDFRLGGNGSWATTNASIDLFSTAGAQIVYTNPTTTRTSNLTIGKNFDDNSNTASLGIGTSGGGMSMTLNSSTGITILDQLFNRGLGDIDDYSANKTAFSYITKQWSLSTFAKLSGGNTFIGLQLLTNGAIQPYSAYSESGFLNTLQSNTLTTNVNTYLPEYNSVLATLPAIGGTAPTPTGAGIKGQTIITGGYRYECTAANTWIRSAVEVTW